MTTNPPNLQWKNPPPDRRGQRGDFIDRWTAVAEQLRTRPDEWALIHTDKATRTSTIVSRIKNGAAPFGPPGSFEATSRRNSHANTSDVYARYIAPTTDGDPIL